MLLRVTDRTLVRKRRFKMSIGEVGKLGFSKKKVQNISNISFSRASQMNNEKVQ